MIETRAQYQVRPAAPADEDAEQAVLGAILVSQGEALVPVLPILKSCDFYLEKNAHIYEACGALYARHEPIDFLAVQKELDQRKQLAQVGGAPYLIELINSVPTAVHAEHYAHLVERARVHRDAIRAAGEIAAIGYDAELDPAEVVSKMGSIVAQVRGGQRSKFRTAYDVGMGLEARIQNRFDNPGAVWGLPTGLKKLDEAMGGMEPSNLVIIAAPAGAGKSALAEQIAVNVAETGKGVAYFSLEMSAEEHLQRMVGIRYGFDTIEIRKGLRDTGAGWRRWTDAEQVDYFNAHAKIETLPIHFNDAASITTDEACASATELAALQDVDLVIFDYLQLAGIEKGRRDNRTAEVGAISRGLKRMAKTLNVPVVALSQINRAAHEREDKRPQLWDLRESGGIEADADVVLFIYRANYYFKTEADWKARYPKVPYPENEAELILSKGRNLQLGYVKQVWDAPHTRFMELAQGGA